MIALAEKTRQNPANEPRFKKGHGARKGFWYLFTDGKKVALTRHGAPQSCTGKNGSRIEREQARVARDKYLDECWRQAYWQDRAERKGKTVGEVLTPYLNDYAPTCKSSQNITNTLNDLLDGREVAERGCLPFRGFRNLPFEQLGNKHVEQWAKAHPNWSDTGRANALSTLRAALNYAAKKGIIDANPLKNLELKYNTKRRECITDAEEGILRDYMSPALLAWFDAALLTGARPMELGKSTSGHVQTSNDGKHFIVLEQDEWKNGKKLGTGRVILDISKRTLLPHTPDWLCLNSLPHKYDPEATCDEWLEFLHTTFNGDAEVVQFLQEWFGYCLIPAEVPDDIQVAVAATTECSGALNATYVMPRDYTGVLNGGSPSTCWQTTFSPSCDYDTIILTSMGNLANAQITIFKSGDPGDSPLIIASTAPFLYNPTAVGGECVSTWDGFLLGTPSTPRATLSIL